MKKKILCAISLAAIMSTSVLFTACSGDTELPRSFTVTFVTGENSSEIASKTVKEGYSIGEVETPTNSLTAIFRGWYTDETYTEECDVSTYRVTEDMTLYAKWSYPQSYPTEFELGDDAFTKSITWIQTGVTSPSQITVTAYLGEEKDNYVYDSKLDTYVKQGTYIDYTDSVGYIVKGTTNISEYELTFTADEAFTGGVYKLVVSTNISGVEDAEFTDVRFKGNGTSTDPYCVYNESDLEYITTNSFSSDTYVELMQDVTIHSVYSDKKGCTFSGIFNGNGYTITIKNNSGLFYEIGASGEVYNLKFKGSISGSDPSIGVVANYNSGYIHDVESSAVSVNSQGGKTNNLSTLSSGGAGGIVGTNYASGEITACTVSSAQDNVIQGKIGVGSVAGVNYGYIHDMTVSGIVGAYNGNETSATINNTYAGCAVGVNYGTLYRLNVDGKINCRRISEGSEGDGASNIGGVAGYNATGALIDECFFQGMRCVGDTNVGGIAGYNDGTITNCYTGRRVRKPSNTTDEERQFISPVTGSYNVGGIAGKCGDNSVISNCFSTANVWSYGMQAYAVAERADNSVYCLYNQNYRTSDRWLGQKYGVVYSDTLKAPEGENLIEVDNSARKNLVINHLLGWDVEQQTNTYTGATEYVNVKNETRIAEILAVLGSSFKSDSTWGVVLSWNR